MKVELIEKGLSLVRYKSDNMGNVTNVPDLLYFLTVYSSRDLHIVYSTAYRGRVHCAGRSIRSIVLSAKDESPSWFSKFNRILYLLLRYWKYVLFHFPPPQKSHHIDIPYICRCVTELFFIVQSKYIRYWFPNNEHNIYYMW